MKPLFKPFVVFDAGIGSYLIADMIRKRYPRQDVLYIADRKSFPYGSKPPEDLLLCIQRVVNAALRVNPAAIVVASNAPTVVVFDHLVAPEGVALRGVFPPIRQSLGISKSKQVIVMGVRSLVESAALKSFVALEQKAAHLEGDVVAVNASSMVELVESGLFLSDPEATQLEVDRFISAARPPVSG